MGHSPQASLNLKKSLLYYDRLYTIYQALSNLKVRGAGTNIDMAEVGVYKGGTSYFILSVVESLELGLRDIALL